MGMLHGGVMVSVLIKFSVKYIAINWVHLNLIDIPVTIFDDMLNCQSLVELHDPLHWNWNNSW